MSDFRSRHVDAIGWQLVLLFLLDCYFSLLLDSLNNQTT